MQARIANGVVHDIAFEARGCALSRASAARTLATRFEHFVQSAPDAAIPDDLDDRGAFSGVRRFRSRRACAVLAFRALLASLDRGP